MQREANMPQDNVVDANKPSASRIYDYLLGGRHNFEADRLSAERLSQLVPFLREGARLQRWCLKDIAIELTERRGYDVLIDFASGLPTNEHIHHVVPKGTTVIYSDSDPLTVEYSREILADTPDVYIFQGDAGRPDEFLNRADVQEKLKGRKDVAFISWGVSAYLNDDALAYSAKYLYDWSGPKSCWVFNAQNVGLNVDDPSIAQAIKVYKQMGSQLYMRSMTEFLELLKPWQPDQAGFVSLLEWHGFDENIMPEAARQVSKNGGNFGAYLNK